MCRFPTPASDAGEKVTYKADGEIDGAKPTEGKPTVNGHWLETFYSWMAANCFTTEIN